MGRGCIRHATKHYTPSHLDHVLEFGVCGGASLKIIKEELDKKKDGHTVFGFDSFIGLPEDWITIDGEVLLKKGYFSTKGKNPEIADVRFFKGWFKDTIPEYLKIAKKIALLHIDCDLYSSTVDVLDGVQEFISEGTVIVFDDWFYERNPRYNDGNQKAFYEWIEETKREYKFLDYPGCEGADQGHKIVEIV